MNIAITGTVGCGKSYVAAILAGLMQVECLDTDDLCRDLLQAGHSGWHELKKKWPSRFFNEKGDLDRRLLREAVFAEGDVRCGLEQILHPLVWSIVESRMKAATERAEHLLVEVPLLFETGWDQGFGHVVTVYAPTPVCLVRATSRDMVSRRQVESILALQLSPEEKAGRADSVIDNSNTWVATVVQASRLARNLQPPCLD